jgi:hypothetical protein
MKGRVIYFPSGEKSIEGIALVSRAPLSFYGGIDAKSGVVIEKGHELEGKNVKDRILVFPNGKGSTVGSYVIYGLKKNGFAPKAIINKETETIVATGAILAGIPCVDKVNTEEIKEGERIQITTDGEVTKVI